MHVAQVSGGPVANIQSQSFGFVCAIFPAKNQRTWVVKKNKVLLQRIAASTLLGLVFCYLGCSGKRS